MVDVRLAAWLGAIKTIDNILMLREIHIGSFSKIITNFRPELFSSLTVVDSRPYNPHVECYAGTSALTQHTTPTKTDTSCT